MTTMRKFVIAAIVLASAAGCMSEPPPSTAASDPETLEATSTTSEDLSATRNGFLKCAEPDFTCTSAARCGAPPESLSESCGPHLFCCFVGP